MSLAKASERFLKKKGISSVGHVKLESACEIDTKCQKVLKSTYGHCVFQDITKLDIEKKVGYCTSHCQMCKLQPKLDDQKRFLPSTAEIVL